jgi:hypothetical protein
MKLEFDYHHDCGESFFYTNYDLFSHKYSPENPAVQVYIAQFQ